jgi:methionyl aminopeptidase
MNDLDVNDRNPRVKLHKPEHFAQMRKAGQLVAECVDMLVEATRPGVTTAELDKLCVQFAHDNNAIPATVNYRGYKYATCISINHVVCHGMPSEKPLLDGDIVNIDVALIVDGWYGDTSRMVNIGNVSRKAERLVEITHESLMRGIAAVKPGNTLGDVGHAIQSFAEAERCSVVRDFCGHGLGQVFHDHPNVLHYGKPGQGVVLKPGMFFTIEPMINLGKAHVKVLSDGWTAVTRDRSLSAQFEHTVAVTETGCEIFTLSPKGLHQPPYNI